MVPRPTARMIRGTTGAGTITAAPAPLMTPRHTHSHAHRIIFHDGVLVSVRTGGAGPAPTEPARAGPGSRGVSSA